MLSYFWPNGTANDDLYNTASLSQGILHENVTTIHKSSQDE